MAITYARLQAYLNAIAAKADLNAGAAGHRMFWRVPYDEFINGTVPTKRCGGNPVPLIDPANKTNSAFFLILQGPWCGMPQMPMTGPFITDQGYYVALADGSQVTGAQIIKDIHDWLAGGALENG